MAVILENSEEILEKLLWARDTADEEERIELIDEVIAAIEEAPEVPDPEDEEETIEVPFDLKHKGFQLINKYKPITEEEAIDLLIRELKVTEEIAEEIYYSWKNIYPTGKSW